MGVACATSGRGSCGHTKAVAGDGGQQERADQTRFETRRDTSRVRPAQDVPRHTQGWILVHTEEETVFFFFGVYTIWF